MKTEKRLFTLCLVVLMSLPLFGCGEDQGTAQAPEASAPAWEDESSWVLAQTKPCALTDEGFYFASENGTLCFADTSNGISVCLCSKPGCLHNTEWCDAIVSSAPISRPMFFWNHHIFYVAEDEFGTHVYRRNADGTAKTMVADLGIRYIEERMSVDLYYFAQSGDYLYYDAVVHSTVLTEEEETSVQEMTYIGRLNLKTNQEEIILESEHTLFLDAVCPEGILFSYCEDGDIDFEAENRKEQLDAAPAYVKFWNSKTGEVSTVLSRKKLDLTDVFSVRGSKLYYSRNGKQQGIWEYDMTTGNDRRVCGFNHDLQIDGRLVFKKIDGISTLFDLRTGKLLPTAFAGESLSVMTVSSDGVVLKRLLFEGGNTATSTTYCYVKREDLADGLQKEDVLDLYTYLNEKPITSEEEMWDKYFGQDG